MGHIFGLKFKYLLICADHPNVNLQLIGKSNNIPGLGILCRITGNNDTEMLSERVAAAESKCWHMIILLFVADSFMFSSKMFQVLSYHFCFMYQQIQLFFCRFYQSRCWLVKKAYLMTWYIFTDQHWATLSHLIWVKSQTQLRSFGEWTPGLAARSEGARTPRRAVFCQ